MTSTSTVIHTPTYILRRRMIMHLLGRYTPGRFLEIGCGRGDLLPYLARLGFEGAGLEISPEVLPIAREAILPYKNKISLVDSEWSLNSQLFQYVLAFEVLEHIHNDAAALVNWRKWLAPGGRLIMTVPAHMTSWTTSDDAVGHYRRYERTSLYGLLSDCGYTVEVFWSYGFPLMNLTRRFRRFLYKARSKELAGRTKQDRTLHSSLDSTLDLSWSGIGVGCIISLMEVIGLTFHWGQLPFRQLDIGDGYIVVCRTAEQPLLKPTGNHPSEA